MTDLNFFKRLADRILDTNIRSDLSIKPATIPDLLPDKFQGSSNAEAMSNALRLHPLTARTIPSNAKLMTGADLSNSQMPLRKDAADDKETSKELPNIKLLDSAKIEPMQPAIAHSSSDDTDEEGQKIDATASNLDVSKHRIQPLVKSISDTVNSYKDRSPPEHELDLNFLVDAEKTSSNKENAKFNIHLPHTSNSDTSLYAHLRINNNDENVVTAPDKTSNLSKLTDDPTNTEKILQRDSLTFSSAEITRKDQEKKTEVTGYSNKAEIFARDNFQEVKIQPEEIDRNDSVNSLGYLEPTVTVNIGRIEVKAVLPSPSTTSSSISPPATFSPPLSLKEYLKQRAKGKNI
jgi:hypothetical protein